MPKHNDLEDSLTIPDQHARPRKYTKKDACAPLGCCGLLIGLGLLCGYLINASYLIEDGSI
jgi:hypothetical protein